MSKWRLFSLPLFPPLSRPPSVPRDGVLDPCKDREFSTSQRLPPPPTHLSRPPILPLAHTLTQVDLGSPLQGPRFFFRCSSLSFLFPSSAPLFLTAVPRWAPPGNSSCFYGRSSWALFSHLAPNRAHWSRCARRSSGFFFPPPFSRIFPP